MRFQNDASIIEYGKASDSMGDSTKLEMQPADEALTRADDDRASQVLLRALIRRPDAKSLEEIRRLVPDFRDWNAVLQQAQQHRVSQIVLKRLQESGVLVPATVQRRLKVELERSVFHALASAAELIAILRDFSGESIDAMPFKGVVLASSIYNDLTARPAGDIDLLIRYRDLKQATALMLNRGYDLTTEVMSNGSPVHKEYYEYHFERRTDGMVVELRWRLDLFESKFNRDVGMDWAWPTRRTAIVAGAQVPNLDPDRMLLMLCMHGSKHLWSRLIWISDVAQLLECERELNWRQMLRQAKRLGLWRSVALGVQLAHRVIGTPVPRDVLKSLESDVFARSLAEYFEKSVIEAPGVPPPGRLPYHFKLLGFRDRIRLLLSLDFLRPNERDFEMLRLPKPLQPLYFFFRPFRLFRDRSPR